MRQLSIWDIDFCPAPKNQPLGWMRIPDTAKVDILSGSEQYTGARPDGVLVPDRTGKGVIDGERCIIGYLLGVSGPGECYKWYLPKLYKKEEFYDDKN